MLKLSAFAASASILVFCSTSTAAVSIPGMPGDPVADSFGTLAGATFGGSGIPNDAVAISTVVSGDDTITLGISATPRFSSPTPTNDGMGGFVAQTGESDPGAGLWNFSFYASIDGPGTFADYDLNLFYDLDAAAGTPLSNHGSLSLSLLGGSLIEGSQNPGFGFLAGVPPLLGVTPPAPLVPYSAFDMGEYTFLMQVSDAASGALLDQVAMSVSTVPEAGAFAVWALVSCSVGVVAGRRRRLRAI